MYLLYLCRVKQKQKPATPHFDRINPSGCINSKIRRLHRMLNRMYMKQFKPFGIQGSMLPILFIIGKRKEVNQKTLADQLVLDQSTMSRDLKKLSTKGWIHIEKGADPRHSVLSLTREGYLLLEAISPVWEKLHHSVSKTIGEFSIQQIDHITEAVRIIGSRK